jgi:two-component system response regulator MprA
MATILAVADDPKLLSVMQRLLVCEGYQVLTATNGREALVSTQQHRPDVVVLDWRMPEMDGIAVVKALRGAGDHTMVLMLSSRDSVEDRVEGLDSGADDCLSKPFALSELTARIRSLLRRPQEGASEPLVYSDLYLNCATRESRRGDRILSLTCKEFDLLRYLMRHPRQVLSRTQILADVWCYDFNGDDNIVEVYVGYLRRKTEARGEARLIQTVRGVGYILREL